MRRSACMTHSALEPVLLDYCLRKLIHLLAHSLEIIPRPLAILASSQAVSTSRGLSNAVATDLSRHGVGMSKSRIDHVVGSSACIIPIVTRPASERRSSSENRLGRAHKCPVTTS